MGPNTFLHKICPIYLQVFFTLKQEIWLRKHLSPAFANTSNHQDSDLHWKTVMQEVSAAKEESTSSIIYLHFFFLTFFTSTSKDSFEHLLGEMGNIEANYSIIINFSFNLQVQNERQEIVDSHCYPLIPGINLLLCRCVGGPAPADQESPSIWKTG